MPARRQKLLPELPLTLQTPECREAWADWLADKAERRKPVTTRAATIIHNRALAEGWSPAAFVAAVRHSIANGWQTIYPDPNHKEGAGARQGLGPRDAGALQDAVRLALRGDYGDLLADRGVTPERIQAAQSLADFPRETWQYIRQAARTARLNID